MRAPAIAVLFALGALPLGTASAADSPEHPAAAPTSLGLLKAIDEGFSQIFEKVAPSVVVIDATKPQVEEEAPAKDFEFFLDDAHPQRRDAEKDRLPAVEPPTFTRSEGSGFIVRPDGYILTNDHVVADAEKIEVRLKDGRVMPARLIGADKRTDIAVLKVDSSDLPTVQWGDSDHLRIGQLVCAIGAPFSQDYSFTAGWVSGKNRTNLLGPSSATILYEDYIQTDAFINPGNSGGPLFDVEGKIVGMNTLINGLGRGLAFAIPSSMLQEVANQLIARGKVQWPWLGIRIETLAENASLRSRFQSLGQGVVVDTVEADAPAYKSDLRPVDVITEVDGEKVGSAHDLQRLILRKKVGQQVQLTVWRAGRILEITVATGELPTQITKVANVSPVRTLPAWKAETLGLKLRDAAHAGAQIVSVAPESPAAQADLVPEDLITHVENVPVTDAAGCVSAIATGLVTKGAKGIILNVERHGRRTFVILAPHLPSPP